MKNEFILKIKILDTWESHNENFEYFKYALVELADTIYLFTYKQIYD